MVNKTQGSVTQLGLMSLAEVAVYMGVCRQTVYTYVYKLGLPTVKLHGVRRVRPEALDKWIEQREVSYGK